MRWPAYPSYKPSAVEWLGDVPTHWTVARSDGRVFTAKSQVTPERFAGTDVMHYSIPVVQETGTGAAENGDDIASAKQLIDRPVVLVSRLNPRKSTICRAVPHAELLTLASTEFVALCPIAGDLRYLEYLTSSELFRQRLDSWVQSVTRSHQRARPEEIYRFWSAWPGPDEQRSIADFLDREAARIDVLVAKKRTLIERLKEKRASLISRTVIQGLPPEAARAAGLDPHPKLKPSGAEWFGHVPEHWELKRGRFCMLVNPPSKRFRELPGDAEISFVPMDAIGEYGGLKLDVSRAVADVGSGYTHFEDGDVLVAKITPCFENGKGALAVGLLNGVALGTTELHVLRAAPGLDRRFLFYVTLSHPFRSSGEGAMYGAGGQKRVPPEFCEDFCLPLPPPDEQQAIGEFLDGETTRLDLRVLKVESAIELLQEYRKALITAAVTGKIDVRGAGA